MAWRVDDVDAMSAPIGSRRGGRNRDAALLLLNHIIHGGSAFMYLAEFVNLARIVQNSLRRRGFTGVNVCHDPDVAGFFQ
ncbi:hypothetical protein SDC9_186846 [bioreactor metagenome]|uniref:Uncharacterized protein n=1 Tax=bioreactor metagenome TaxID=1076179 RepID=A0A645HJX6_9ZZZZ